MGAHLIGRLADGLRVGVSYVNRNVERESYVAFRPDSLLSPVAVTVDPASRAEHILGGDVR